MRVLRMGGLAAGLLAWAAGCVDVKGGAVELAWRIFAPSGAFCCSSKNPCHAAGAQVVRLHLRPGSCMADELPLHSFACSDVQSSTAFDILPEGTYCITVDAADAAGAAVAVGPGPIFREVTRGEVVELGAIALTVTDAQKCPPDDSQCPE